MAKKNEHQSIIDRVISYIAEGETHCPDKHSRIEENINVYEAGPQWSKGDLEAQALKDKPAITRNSIIKVINAIANKEITDRFEPRVFGRSGADGGVSTVLDIASRWQRDMAETEHEESAAFRSAVASGYGVMHKYFDTGMWDGEGKVCDEEIPAWHMLWPARARKSNLVDRRWHVYGKTMTFAEGEYVFGDISPASKKFFRKLKKDRDIFYDTNKNTLVDTKKNTFGGLSWSQIRNGKWYNLAEEEIFVIESEWIEPKTIWRAAVPVRFAELWSLYIGEAPSIPYETVVPNPETGEEEPQQTELTREQVWGEFGPNYDLIKEILSETDIDIFEDKEELDLLIEQYEELTLEPFEDYIRVSKEIFKYAIVCDDIVIDSGERPYGFTFEFMTGWRKESREGVDFYGIIDVAKGHQDLQNAILSSMLAVYMVSPKQPLLIEEDSLPDPDQFLNEYAKPRGVAFVPAGFLSSNKMQQLDSPRFPAMMPEFLSLASSGIEEMFGLSSIDLGNQGDLRRVSGTTVQAAKSAGNTIVAVFFDSLRRFRKRYGLLNLKFITEHYSVDQLVRITGEENGPDLEQLPDTWGNVYKFDVKVEESPVSASEKMELLSKLQQVGSIDAWLEKDWVDLQMVVDNLLPGIPESFKRALSERGTQKMEVEKQLESTQTELDRITAYQTALTTYIQQNGGAELMANFELLSQQAIPMAEQMQQQYQSAQEEQAQTEEG